MRAFIVAGLGFGDEGKGSVVDALVRMTGASLVVRWNGGPQAGHNVVDRERGIHHTFSQFGAGALAGARTHLSARMLVDPLALAVEGRMLAAKGVDALALRPTVDPEAPIVTPWHRALNRLRELSRGDGRHGSCGLGVGELAEDLARGRDVIRAGQIKDLEPAALCELAEVVAAGKRLQAASLPPIEPTREACEAALLLASPPWGWVLRILEAAAWMRVGPMPEADVAVFEGAQGALLDEDKGFAPHTTWSRTVTPAARELIAEICPGARVTAVGVIRAYHTRHGAGPFPTEIDTGWAERLAEGDHNRANPWQGAFRVGHFDAVLARYALAVSPCDVVAVTCADRCPPPPWWCARRYQQAIDIPPNAPPEALAAIGGAAWAAPGRWRLAAARPVLRPHDGPAAGVAAETGARIGLVSAGPAAGDKTFLNEGGRERWWETTTTTGSSSRSGTASPSASA